MGEPGEPRRLVPREGGQAGVHGDDGVGPAVEQRGIEAHGGGATVEKILRRPRGHAQHPIHHRAGAIQPQRAILGAADRHHVAIQARCGGRVQRQFPPRGAFALCQRGEVQKGQSHRFAQLVDRISADEDGGDVGFQRRHAGQRLQGGGGGGLFRRDGHGASAASARARA